MKDLLRIRIKALLLIAILLLSVVGGLSAKKIAIIDAGSSGSRFYVYDIDDNTRLLRKEQLVDDTKGDALSLISNTQESVNLFLENMTGKYSAAQEKDKIDLYVLATAGMRLVNSTEANSIYTKMKHTSLSHYELKAAMTISGQYEGLYAWIAANYKNSTLTWNVSSWKLENPYGILEIGGASMQIAFIRHDDDSSDCIPHSKFGKVYSKSYLGGGVDQVFDYSKLKSVGEYVQSLDDLDQECYGDTQFIRLGTPMRKAIETAGGETVDALNTYGNCEGAFDVSPYHTKTNAKYIAGVFEKWHLERRTIQASKESDWTMGAALDIVVNNQQPEPFNYDPANPN